MAREARGGEPLSPSAWRSPVANDQYTYMSPDQVCGVDELRRTWHERNEGVLICAEGLDRMTVKHDLYIAGGY